MSQDKNVVARRVQSVEVKPTSGERPAVRVLPLNDAERAPALPPRPASQKLPAVRVPTPRAVAMPPLPKSASAPAKAPPPLPSRRVTPPQKPEQRKLSIASHAPAAGASVSASSPGPVQAPAVVATDVPPIVAMLVERSEAEQESDLSEQPAASQPTTQSQESDLFTELCDPEVHEAQTANMTFPPALLVVAESQPANAPAPAAPVPPITADASLTIDRPSAVEAQKFFDSAPVEPEQTQAALTYDPGIELAQAARPVRLTRRQMIILGTAIGLCAIILAAAAVRVFSSNATRETPSNVPTQLSEPKSSVGRAAETKAPLPAAEAARVVAPRIHGDGSESPVEDCDSLNGAEGRYSETATAYNASRAGHKELVRGNLKASQAAFCKALLWNNAKANMHLDLAQVLLLRRDAEAAVKHVRSALAMEPSKRGKQLLGDALVRTGAEVEAQSAWLEVMGIAADNQTAIQAYARGELAEAERALKKRDYIRAERLFRRAAALHESYAAHAGLGAALSELGFSQAAELWIGKALEAGANDVNVQLIAGDVRLQAGDLSAAEQHFKRALALDPKNDQASRRLKKN